MKPVAFDDPTVNSLKSLAGFARSCGCCDDRRRLAGRFNRIFECIDVSDLNSIHEQATQLSPRQKEILRLLGSGLSLSESADRLEISRSTANSHRARLMERLELGNRNDLIEFAQHCRVADDIDNSVNAPLEEPRSRQSQNACVASLELS